MSQERIEHKDTSSELLQQQLGFARQLAEAGSTEFFRDNNQFLTLVKERLPETWEDIRTQAYWHRIHNLNSIRRLDPDTWETVSREMTIVKLEWKREELPPDEEIPLCPAFAPSVEELQFQEKAVDGGLLSLLNYRRMPWLRLLSDEELLQLHAKCISKQLKFPKGNIGLGNIQTPPDHDFRETLNSIKTI